MAKKRLSPSEAMTEEQVGKAVELFNAALSKRREFLTRVSVQRALGLKCFGRKMADAFQELEEVFSKMVIFKQVDVRPSLGKSLDWILGSLKIELTGGSSIPKDYGWGTVEWSISPVDVYCFELDSEKEGLSDDEVAAAYRLRGLKPVDLRTLLCAHRQYPSLFQDWAATHWKDDKGCWHHISFCNRSGGRVLEWSTSRRPDYSERWVQMERFFGVPV
jgi:hypothetical protein